MEAIQVVPAKNWTYHYDHDYDKWRPSDFDYFVEGIHLKT